MERTTCPKCGGVLEFERSALAAGLIMHIGDNGCGTALTVSSYHFDLDGKNVEYKLSPPSLYAWAPGTTTSAENILSPRLVTLEHSIDLDELDGVTIEAAIVMLRAAEEAIGSGGVLQFERYDFAALTYQVSRMETVEEAADRVAKTVADAAARQERDKAQRLEQYNRLRAEFGS